MIFAVLCTMRCTTLGVMYDVSFFLLFLSLYLKFFGGAEDAFIPFLVVQNTGPWCKKRFLCSQFLLDQTRLDLAKLKLSQAS